MIAFLKEKRLQLFALISMFSQLLWLILSLILFLTWRLLKFTGQTKKIHGIYSQPTIFYWPKFFLIRFLIGYQQSKREKNKETFKGDIFHMTRRDKQKKYDPNLIEQKQKLPKGIDFDRNFVIFFEIHRNVICW